MRIKFTLLFLSVISLTVFGIHPTSVQAANTSYTGTNWEVDPPIPLIQPTWSLATDKVSTETMNSTGWSAVTSGKGKVFLLQNGNLLALNSKTGKKVWAFGSMLSSSVLYSNGVVYAKSENGTIFAVNATNGKKIWGTNVKVSGITQFYTNGELFYAVNGDLHAFDLKTGKWLWSDDYAEKFGGPLWFSNDKILISSSISGAYTYDVLLSFSAQTGRLAWTAANSSQPLLINKDTVIVQRTSNLMTQLELTTLDTLNASSGKVVKTVEYKPQGKAWIDSNRIYINVSTAVYGYPLDADPDKAIRDTYKPESGYTTHWAGGPDAGRLLFTDGMYITGVKLVNKTTVFYGWLGNPIARFDAIGNGLYVALTDGKVVALDLITGKSLFQLQMPSRVFGPTLQADGMIIVQSKGRVSAFPEPAQLKASP
ncbi:MAG: PQQ-binding-like beta-propeller repeat protein [Paenibacillus sp.]|nr:PQQ-binding-like beta-propeller repeat protein [Paenibacillus sp.]